MAVQTRTSALQNEIVRLYCHFNSDGVLTNPGGQPLVEIIDTDGVTVLDSLPAQQEGQGIYYADWYVPQNLPLGQYYDRWTYQISSESSVKEQTMVFSVYSLDSYVNFLSKGRATSISNRASQLMLDLSNDFIYEAMHIPIYFEQGMRIQQDNQTKRTKKYYYFTVSEGTEAYSGDKYVNNGQIFTVFESLPYSNYSSSSSSSSIDSSSSSSQDSSSSSSSSSNANSSSSSSESEISSTSSSSTSEEIETPTPIPYVHKIVLTCVGTGNPDESGLLTLHNGSGDSTIEYSEFDYKQSSFSTVYSFAYENWNTDPRPIVRVNNRIVDDGWHADYMGKIYFDSLMAPEDSISTAYNFAYFSTPELLSFLQFGLKMMNGLPPASIAYGSLEQAPAMWDAGILLYAATLALKRLIFGLSWQEKRVIYGRPEDAQNASSLYQDLYKSYQETWTEFGKNVKTLRLPSISQYVTPEYTLPGGRCMSSDTCIISMVDGVVEERTIIELFGLHKKYKKIEVLSYANGKTEMAEVSKIWESGSKLTYKLQTSSASIRLSKEHLVYDALKKDYKPVFDFIKGDTILVKVGDGIITEKLIDDPEKNCVEQVFDIEVPSTENFIGNNIVSHNSRWFRYLFKTNA